MTTSVEATVHGHLLAALGANPAGPVAVLAAVAFSSDGGRHSLRVPTLVLLAVVLGMWIFELHRFSLI